MHRGVYVMVFEIKAVTVDVRESDHLNGDVNKESKHKCGRPTKVQENFSFKKKDEIETRESYHSDIRDNGKGKSYAWDTT